MTRLRRTAIQTLLVLAAVTWAARPLDVLIAVALVWGCVLLEERV